MELIEPRHLRIDEVTAAMLADLAELARQVNEVRPLSAEILLSVKDQLLGERVFSSNAIEGNPLTIRETRLILQTKPYLDIKRKRHAAEALSLGEATKQVEQLWDTEEDWHSVFHFLEIHSLLMKDVNESIRGVLRNRDVMINGAKHQPPDASRVSDLVDRVFSTIRDFPTPGDHDASQGLILATWVHWAITRVHPFEDGNGRMARLWQDLILLKYRLTIAIIRPQDRVIYFDALTRADDGNFNPLLQLICQCVLSTFQTYLNAQEAADQLRGWASELVGEASAIESEKRKLTYHRWRHAVEQLRDAFQRCASLINRGANPSVEIQIQDFEIIDQPTWETLLAGGKATRTCYFRVWFRKNEAIVWYYFYFGKHYWMEKDDTIGLNGPLVNMMVSQQHRGEAKATPLDSFEDSPIALREMLVVDKKIIRRRGGASHSTTVYDFVDSPMDVAKEFFQDVLLKKLI